MNVLKLSLFRCVLLNALKNQVSHKFLNFWLPMKELNVWQIVPTFAQHPLERVEANSFGQE